MPDPRRALPACLGLLLALLIGCAPAVRKAAPEEAKSEATAPAAPLESSDSTLPVQPAASAAVEPPAAADLPAKPLWQAIVDRHGFVQCEQPSAAVRRWQRIYLQSPQRHAETLHSVSPWIGYVAEALENRGLPSEFVWLPFVESRYQPVRSRGDRPAGAWQMMPATARWRGLRIDAQYDGRLDFAAATDAALDLIEHLASVFDRNWALVTMAYNAGEYRIKGALDKARRNGDSLEPEQLAVSPITHEHLVKLRALACSIVDPATHALQLPEVEREQQLVSMQLRQTTDASRIRHLLGVDEAQWRRWNPAWRGAVIPQDAHIMLPRALHALHADALVQLPPTDAAPTALATDEAQSEHVVVAGESAWTIARRHGVALSALLAANGLTARSVLRPGQRLRLP